MNNVGLVGNLTRDAELRFTKNGSPVASFTLACGSDKYTTKDGEEKEHVAFVNCVAWGKLGEAAGNLRKGSRCFVEGRLQTRSYEAQDGTKRYVTEVVAKFIGQSLEGGANQESNFDNFGSTPLVAEESMPF